MSLRTESISLEAVTAVIQQCHGPVLCAMVTVTPTRSDSEAVSLAVENWQLVRCG